MNINNKGLELIKKYEGCRLTAYQCVAGVWTIGYGHTKNVTKGMIITQQQADNFLLEDIQTSVHNVNKFQSKYNFNENEFSALVSFAFNIGSINKLTANGTRTKAEIIKAIPKYCNANGKFVQGLYNRRISELELFNTPVTNITLSSAYKTIKKGSKGDIVKILQNTLIKCKFLTATIDGKRKKLTVDGDFGIITETIVKRFQKCYGLKQDGVVGVKTWVKLEEVSNNG